MFSIVFLSCVEFFILLLLRLNHRQDYFTDHLRFCKIFSSLMMCDASKSYSCFLLSCRLECSDKYVSAGLKEEF